ncbi:hypothetical protein ACVXG7_16400 [Enterobacter hormaechei]
MLNLPLYTNKTKYQKNQEQLKQIKNIVTEGHANLSALAQQANDLQKISSVYVDATIF